jgi:hypothetical protein
MHLTYFFLVYFYFAMFLHSVISIIQEYHMQSGEVQRRDVQDPSTSDAFQVESKGFQISLGEDPDKFDRQVAQQRNENNQRGLYQGRSEEDKNILAALDNVIKNGNKDQKSYAQSLKEQLFKSNDNDTKTRNEINNNINDTFRSRWGKFI